MNRLREANEEGVGVFKEDEKEGVELKDLSAIGVVTDSDDSDGEVESVLEGLVAIWLGLRKDEVEGVEGIDAAIVTVTVEGCEGDADEDEGTKRDNCFALRVFLRSLVGVCNEKACVCVCEGCFGVDGIDESKEDVVGVWEPTDM